MRDSIYRISLDIHNETPQVQITAKKDDSARRVYATLTEHGRPFLIPERSRAVTVAAKPDGGEVQADCDIRSDGTVIFDFTAFLTDETGLIHCTLFVYDEAENIIASPVYSIYVTESAGEYGSERPIYKRELAAVATSGEYDDLKNKPDLETLQSRYVVKATYNFEKDAILNVDKPASEWDLSGKSSFVLRLTDGTRTIELIAKAESNLSNEKRYLLLGNRPTGVSASGIDYVITDETAQQPDFIYASMGIDFSKPAGHNFMYIGPLDMNQWIWISKAHTVTSLSGVAQDIYVDPDAGENFYFFPLTEEAIAETAGETPDYTNMANLPQQTVTYIHTDWFTSGVGDLPTGWYYVTTLGKRSTGYEEQTAENDVTRLKYVRKWVANASLAAGGAFGVWEPVPASDAGLTEPGQGADAAVVGGRFAFDESRIAMLHNLVAGATTLLWGADETFEAGAAIAYDTGEKFTNSNSVVTPFVALPEGSTTLRYTRMQVTSSSTLSGMAFYSAASEGSYISGVANTVNASEYGAEIYRAEIPEGAAYARFTYIPTTSPIAYKYPPFYAYVNNDYDSSLLNRVDVLETGLSDLECLVAGVYLPFSFTDGQSIHYDDPGDPVSSASGLAATDYVELPTDGKTLFYTRLIVPQSISPVSTGMAFYDDNKQWLSGIPHQMGSTAYGTKLQKTSIPDGARYARFSYVDSTLIDLYGKFVLYVASDDSLSLRLSNVENAMYAGYKEADLEEAVAIPYALYEYGNTWMDYNASSYRAVSLDDAKYVRITTGEHKTRYIFLKDLAGIEYAGPAHVPTGEVCWPVDPYTTVTVAVPTQAEYICVWESDSYGNPTLPLFVRVMYDNEEEKQKKPIFAPIFNLDLTKTDSYADLMRVVYTTDDPDEYVFDDDEGVTLNWDAFNADAGHTKLTDGGLLMNPGESPSDGQSRYVTIDRYIVCDDVSYRANITIGNTGAQRCTLGTVNYHPKLSGNDTDENPHATIVEFDFDEEEPQIRFKNGPTGAVLINGTTLPSQNYKTANMVNLSGAHYRIEIGRKKRCPYAAVYNLTTGKTCCYMECTEYADKNSYAGRAGALYDFPTFAALEGEIVFERVAAFVPTGVAVAFLGDSNTEGAKLEHKNVWANQVIKNVLHGDGVNMGRGSGTVKHMIRCALDLLPAVKPKYAVVMIGSNGTPERTKTKLIDGELVTKVIPDVNTQNNGGNFSALKALIEAAGAIPIFIALPRGSGALSPSSPWVLRNNIILALDTEHPRFDLATSEENDLAEDQNTDLFVTDKKHLNAAGAHEVIKAFMAAVGWQLS